MLSSWPPRRVDLGFVRAWVGRYSLAVWFGAFSMAWLLTATRSLRPGLDAQIYILAARAWLAGGNPWAAEVGGLYFAAPPPTLLVAAPFALLPGGIDAAAMVVTGIAAAIATVRMLGLPWWWLLFPPLVGAMWLGNPQTWLVPLVIGSAGAVAAITKIYAVPVLLLQGRWRALLVAAVALALTAPILPWRMFLEQWALVSANLAEQSHGGVSWTRIPPLLPVVIVSLLLMGRERASWMIVPTLWPNVLWHYLPFSMPALTPAAAAIAALPVPGAIVAAAVVLAAQERSRTAARARRGAERVERQGFAESG
jgi:hypothetical protein